MDPRNPKRPDGDEGSNWVECCECGRGANKVKLIRHTKHCSARKKDNALESRQNQSPTQ